MLTPPALRATELSVSLGSGPSRRQVLSGLNLTLRAGAWTAIDPAKTYVLVTNDFVAAGGDGYATLKPIYTAGRYVNTYLLYTQSFVDYVKAKGTIARPAAADYSHQKVITRDGVALP